MQLENVTRRVAGSIDVTISSALIERMNDIAGAPRPTEQVIDEHWTAIASIVHRKVAQGEIEEDGSVEIGIADLDIDYLDPVEVARIEAQAELHAIESVGFADRVGRWFGDLPGDDIPW